MSQDYDVILGLVGFFKKSRNSIHVVCLFVFLSIQCIVVWATQPERLN